MSLSLLSALDCGCVVGTCCFMFLPPSLPSNGELELATESQNKPFLPKMFFGRDAFITATRIKLGRVVILTNRTKAK